MASQNLTSSRTWISAWFFITTFVVMWDVGYCFMRPRSMHGGDLHWIWSPYALYQNVDYVYGLPSFERGDGFTNAQSFMNIIETGINVIYLYKTHIDPSPLAPLIGLVGASLTFAKTVLYWAQEYFCGYCAVGHNNMRDLILLWIIPNGLWLVFPPAIAYVLWNDVSSSLKIASRVSKAKALNNKSQ